MAEVQTEIGIKDCIPMVQNSTTKLIAYTFAWNAMAMLDIIFIAAMCGRDIPAVALYVAGSKLVVSFLFLGYLKTLSIKR